MIPQSFVDECIVAWIHRIKVSGAYGLGLNYHAMSEEELKAQSLLEPKVYSMNASKILNSIGSNGYVVHNKFMTHEKVLTVLANLGNFL